jgi:hypothetical protein
MIYALQGTEAKPPYGVAPEAKVEEVAAAATTKDANLDLKPRQEGLSPRSAQILTDIGDLARADRGRRAALEAPAQSASNGDIAATGVGGKTP